MKIGVSVPQFGINSTKENLLQFIQCAEKANFESLWVIDRMLYPINPKQPYPGTPNKKKWPRVCQNILDPLSTLSFIAANTSKLLLGTAVIDVLFHNPVNLGKTFATIDLLSEGRLICGVGIGWSEDEYLAANIPYQKRGERANEFLSAMRKVWTENEVEFNGKYYKIPKSIINPKPFQKPHPRILLGGFKAQTFERMITLGNGYLGALIGTFEDFQQTVKMFHSTIEKNKKTRNEFDLTFLTFPFLTEKSIGDKRNPMTGTIDEIGSDLSKMKDIGVDRVILAINSGEGYDVDNTINLVKELRDFF